MTIDHSTPARCGPGARPGRSRCATSPRPGTAIRLCFLIRRLDDGGAQRQLVELVKGLDPERYDSTVLTFYPGGRFAAEVERLAHTRLICLNKRGRVGVLGFTASLLGSLQRLRPQVLHGYLEGPNCLVAMLKPFVPETRLVWGIRGTALQASHYSWLRRATVAAEQRLARYADLIIANSGAGARDALARGFPREKVTVIPNGIDTRRFRPDPAAGRRLRAAWCVTDTERVVGTVARFDPMKDHETFLAAAARLRTERRDVRFVCVGDGPPARRVALDGRARALGLRDALVWAGTRDDMPAVYSALDVMTLVSAFGEGSPNAVGEAMACGTPCVVTDVGDAARMVGDAGLVVPAGAPEAVADAWGRLLDRADAAAQELGRRARRRIEDEFALDALVARTSRALERLVSCA